MVLRKPALEDDLDELDDLQIPKRLKIVAVKCTYIFLKQQRVGGIGE